MTDKVLSDPIVILGAGVAGLIDAYALIQDGFTNITVITRDRSVGGTWSRDRVYPGLCINNVHGEYRFSALPMPPPENGETTGGHITGMGMCEYMETFYETFLKGRATFKFKTEIHKVARDESGVWNITVQDLNTQDTEVLLFSRVILCTGGCSNPKIPQELSAESAKLNQFSGIVIHSSQFRIRLDDILATVKPKEDEKDKLGGAILVVGGGKSAMDISAKLANEGRRVINVFDSPDRFIASKSAIPDFIRKSRFLSVLTPHRDLRTRLERFLHTTKVGSWVTHFIWHMLGESSLDAYNIPKSSPLRNPFSLFWGIRTNDEGRVHPNSYYSLANTGKIELIVPARAVGYAEDGESVYLSNGQKIAAKVVILATGWQSSWNGILDERTAVEIGLGRHAPTSSSVKDINEAWDYETLKNPPSVHPDNAAGKWVTSVYRGLVPAKNILRRDFAIGGAMFASNMGYMCEVSANWVSGYFRNDPMRLPSSPEEAIEEGERASAWMRRRYPNMLSWINESYSTGLDFWNWPQAADELLEDMYVPSQRSGGNWFTWPFRTVDLSEIATLANERRMVRERRTPSPS